MSDAFEPDLRSQHDLLIAPIIRRALEEDLGRAGDLTTDLIVPAGQQASAGLVARRAGTIAGMDVAETAFRLIDPAIQFRRETHDGAAARADGVLAVVEGHARSILTAERVALNFLGQLSGVATATRALVDALKGTKARIVCSW